MKRLLLSLVLVVAAGAIFLGPPLRAAFAATNVDIVIGRAELHPTAQALAFMLKAPEDEALAAKKKMKLWATYYHMPTVRPSWTSVAAKPLLGKNGKAVSPPLSIEVRLIALPTPPAATGNEIVLPDSGCASQTETRPERCRLRY